MKLLSILFAVFLAACASKPRTHTPPTVAPIAVPVAKTRSAIAETRTVVRTVVVNADAASESALKAADLARQIAEEGAQVNSAKTVMLGAEIEKLNGIIFRVRMDLRDAEQRLNRADENARQAEEQLAIVQKQVSEQTARLNETETQLAKEIPARKKAEATASALRVEFFAYRTKVWLIVAAAIAALLSLFYFRIIRFGL